MPAGMPDVQTINHITLDASAPATSEVEIAKLGTFYDPRYGKFSITPAHFKKWIENFKTLSIGDGREGIPIDIDHSPEKQGTTLAVGWVKSLRETGGKLLARVAWNEKGVQLLEDRQYAYLSPTYADNWVDEYGTEHGTMLRGAGLTNRPKLRMATVNLSEDDVPVTLDTGSAASLPRLLVEDEKIPAVRQLSDMPAVMPLIDDIRAKLGLADDADEATILDSIPEPDAAETPDTRTLAEQAKEAGMHVLTDDQFKTLSEGAIAGVSAAAQLAEQKFEGAFEKALGEGKITPAQKDTFKALYDIDGQSALKALDELPAVINVRPQGSDQRTIRLASLNGDTVLEEGEQMDDERLALDTRATALATEKGIPYGDALSIAMQEASA